jgi:hypothetical protein
MSEERMPAFAEQSPSSEPNLLPKSRDNPCLTTCTSTTMSFSSFFSSFLPTVYADTAERGSPETPQAAKAESGQGEDKTTKDHKEDELKAKSNESDDEEPAAEDKEDEKEEEEEEEEEPEDVCSQALPWLYVADGRLQLALTGITRRV